VAAVCVKKYSWSEDDELWAMWMLDVVGVDHVVIGISTRDLPMDRVRQRLAAVPGLAERVTLVDVDIPRKGMVTYAYLIQCMAWDLFLRWQADFDFAFLIDPDEFVQLFDINPPFARVDARTFISRNRLRIEKEGQAYMNRILIARSKPNRLADPLLAPVLKGMAGLGLNQTFAAMGLECRHHHTLGKALFWFPATVKPYLHYNTGWQKVKWSPQEANMLHIREGDKRGQKGSLRWIVKHLAAVSTANDGELAALAELAELPADPSDELVAPPDLPEDQPPANSPDEDAQWAGDGEEE
jgi:hypothetical protein